MAKIKQIIAREILNSKGNPTIEVTALLSDGIAGSASCPSGTSVGTYEALELKDHDQTRFNGEGVLGAISNIKDQIAPRLIGIPADRQQEIDRIMIELDGTQNKGKLGANALLSVSMAVARASAESSVLPLFLYLREFIKKESVPLKIPTPLFNILNGGKHGGGNVDFQEFLVIPASSKTYTESLAIGVKIYHKLSEILGAKGLSLSVGDEGGFSPNFNTNKEPFEIINQAVESSFLRLGFDVFLGLDAATNSFFQEGVYHLKDSPSLSSENLISYYEDLYRKYNLLYLEDPLSEDDWSGWSAIYNRMSRNTLIVGDDLTTTNPYRLQMALDKKAITGIIIKPNQIGTVTEALAVVEMAKHTGLKTIVSHRSGETNDDFIADFAVATSSDYVKFGAPARGERVAKYNRLLQIEKQLKLL